MTHDEMIAVIRAHKEGKALERRTPPSLGHEFRWEPFRPHMGDMWDFYHWDFRIKPDEPKKPREWVLATDFSGNIIAGNKYCVGAIIEIPGSPLKVGEVIRVREVLPEEDA